MRVIATELAEKLKAGLATLVACAEVICTNGRVYRWAAGSSDVGIYKAGRLFNPSASESSSDLSANNLEFDCFTGPDLTRDDVEAGVLRNATVRVSVVDYTNPDLVLFAFPGRAGEIRLDLSGEKFTIEVLGLTDMLEGSITEQCTPTCRARLGDARCRYPIAGLRVSGTVGSVSSDGVTLYDTTRTESAGWFAFGKVTFTSGAAAGFTREVLGSDSGMLVLAQPLQRPVAAGDTYVAEPGCDKLDDTCFSKFNNVVNFVGEPHVPVAETAFSIPS